MDLVDIMEFLTDVDMIGDTSDPTSTTLNAVNDFEPITRGRANTWHGGRPLKPELKDDDAYRLTPPAGDGSNDLQSDLATAAGVGARKVVARRNAWGNLSYADLITKAIESSSDKRLTLAEIYNWMVQNVPFFKDKGDSNSSAGWKNSIRHNLSLHNRFLRVQNEGTGKSSWWIVNPELKASKVPRRRAATMDNAKAFQQRKGRTKRMDPLGRSSSSEFHSGFFDRSEGSTLECSPPDVFSLSLQEYRVRTSSNASSIGRLSPTLESELDTGHFPSSLKAPDWKDSYEDNFSTLSESLAGIFVENLKNPQASMATNSDLLYQRQQQQQQQQMNCFYPQQQNPQLQVQQQPECIETSPLHHLNQPYGNMPSNNISNGSYSVSLIPSYTNNSGGMLCVGGNMSGGGHVVSTTGQQWDSTLQAHLKRPMLSSLLTQDTPSPPSYCSPKAPINNMMSPSLNAANIAQSANLGSCVFASQPAVSSSSSLGVQFQKRDRMSDDVKKRLIMQLLAEKPHLKSKVEEMIKSRMQQKEKQELNSQCNNMDEQQQQQQQGQLEQQQQLLQQHPSMLQQLLTTGTMPSASFQAATVPKPFTTDFFSEPPLPSDIDFNFLDLDSISDIDCDVDQVISHEMAFGDPLEFNFDNSNLDEFNNLSD